jgi:hypothetical protein
MAASYPLASVNVGHLSRVSWRVCYRPRVGGCEQTRILRALIKHPQGNLEEIQQKTLQSTQEEPVGRQDRKA